MSAKQTILVIGATGKQGGAVIKALDQSKYRIIAATRDASSDNAKALGVELVEGSLEEPDTLFKEPIHGLFFALAAQDPDEHLRQGLAIVEAAAKHGVKHVVYSGSDSSGIDDTGIAFFDLKRKIEASIKSKPFKWTILAPVGFMENFYWPLYLDQVSTTWKRASHSTFKFIAVKDIGKIAAEAFDKPEEFAGKHLNVAGDELTPDQIIDTWKEVTGQTLQAKEDPVFPGAFAAAFQFFNDHQFEADVGENKKLFPWLTDLKSWLQETPFAKK
ncbi:uncharacterized protein I303_107920 [Kwoniella dejecticola CBS 10117]|uniref:NmrA-like domain-containing protein n=1 Tax=Kwoniella dejecticola CBS 10117 TaxID=1296121 RepID=A0A1A5ZW29_9TREE|nr:uncharacterized protein I303_07917 [Kwoniella dejecticola CBS 10117]OBR82004.1 hypothetical protein I303_07917 [Kwoniella dejecticola CBS 10117]